MKGCVVHAHQVAYGCPDCDRVTRAVPVVPEDMPPGVGAFIGYASFRGIVLPMDFVRWLAASPRPLDCEQCIALYVCLRAMPPIGTPPNDGNG